MAHTGGDPRLTPRDLEGAAGTISTERADLPGPDTLGQALVGLDGRWLAVNPALGALLRSDPSELVGRSFREFTHPEELSEGDTLLAALASGRTCGVTFKKRFVRLDGTVLRAKVSVEVIEDSLGRPLHLLSQVEDLGAAAPHPNAPEEVRSTLTALAERHPELVAVTDAAGRLVQLSGAATWLLGRPREGLIGSMALRLVHPDDRALVLAQLRALRAGDGPSAVWTCRLIHPTLGWRHVQVIATDYTGTPGGGLLARVKDVTERVQANARATALLEHSTDLTLITDQEGVIRYASPASTAILSTAPEDLLGTLLAGLFHPDDADQVRNNVRELTGAEGNVVRFSCRVRNPRRGWRTVQVTSTNRSGDPAVKGFVSNLRDITERERASARFAALVAHSADLITVIDLDGLILYASPASARLLDRDPTELLGKLLVDLVHDKDQEHVLQQLQRLLVRQTDVETWTCRMSDTRVGWRSMEVTATNRVDDPAIAGVVINIRDITERVEASARLEHQAMHDSLTGLPVRFWFLERLRGALAMAERQKTDMAVLFIDIDRFKRINDSLGHGAGDQVLKTVAERLQFTLRSHDIVARLGGDEFVVLAEALDGREQANAIAERIREALREPIWIDGHPLTIGCSVGIAFAEDDRFPESLLQEADLAMYRAKELGRDRAEVFSHAMRVEARQRLETEEVIRWALDHDAVEVLYQPVVDLSTGLLAGTEALARIRRPDGDLLGADWFVPVAEATGLILPLGQEVFRIACAQQAAWASEGVPTPSLAINIAARQLLSPQFVTWVAEVLQVTGVKPETVRLELTETTLIDSGSTTASNIAALRELGFRWSLDDFGTGWASLSYLRRFPVDALKIDQSFITGLGTDPDDTAVVKGILGLSAALGMVTVAEGVETLGQEQLLIKLGCNLAQGYRYAPPLRPDELRQLSRRKSWCST